MTLKDYCPVYLIVPFWFALFLGTDPPEPNPAPEHVAPIAIEIDLPTVEDITPKGWR